MPQNTPSCTLDTFMQYQWEELVNQAATKEHMQYCILFEKKVQEYTLSNDVIGVEIFTLLQVITSLYGFSLQGIGDIYENGKLNEYLKRVKTEIYDHRLSNRHLETLNQLVEITSDSEMKARIADILWICRRNLTGERLTQIAKIAVTSYLQSAKRLENSDHCNYSTDRLHRAAQLAALTDGRNGVELCHQVADHIADLVERYREEKFEFLSGSAMKVLYGELRKKLSCLFTDFPNIVAKYAMISAQKALWGETHQDYHKGFYDILAYRRIEAEWYKVANDHEAERQARLCAAEANVWYAQKAIEFEEPNYWGVAAGRIKTAIQELKKIEGTLERTEELHRQMLSYQQQSMSQVSFIPMENEKFHSETQDYAKNLVRGKTLKEALYSLVFTYTDLAMSFEQLKLKAEQSRQSSYLGNYIPVVLLDHEGKTKAISGDGDTIIKDRMAEIVRLNADWYGYNFVAPACEQICSEHQVELDDLKFIVNDNLFIPQRREHLYARGLLAGLQGDPVVSIHLLVPQLENSLRHILRLKGYIASDLSHKNIQEDYTLGKILALPELENILTKDIVFTLKSLLIESMGSNIRNELCHGLLNQDQFFGAEMAYFWWLMLFLCLQPKLEQWVSK
jgi:hypothetical protein